MNHELKSIQEAYTSMIAEGKVTQEHTFQVGDPVKLVWKDVSGETDLGTANIDKASSAYVHIQHPSIKDSIIKCHQGINGKGGHEVGPVSAIKGYHMIKKIDN